MEGCSIVNMVYILFNMMATKTDGTLWGWNQWQGQLGQNRMEIIS